MYKIIISKTVLDKPANCHKVSLYQKGLFPLCSKLLGNIMEFLHFPKASDRIFL